MSAPVILKRIYSSVDDKRIILSNGTFARLHGVASWTKLRVAVRWSMTDFGANLGSTPELSVGLCSGTTNIYKDATTTHFLGMQAFGATWTRATSPVNACYTTGASSIRPMKRVGTTTTTGTSGGNGFNLTADPTGSSTHRVMTFIDITAGSPNYTIGGFLWDFGTSVDVTESDFLAQAELASPSFTGHVAATNATIAANEGTDGALNAVNIYWDRTTPQIEISDIAVARLS